MPNHVTHRLKIKGPKSDRDAFIEKHVNGRLLDFETFIPMPEEIRNTQSPNRDEALSASLMMRYGHPDWYSWSRANWGTKWNAYTPHDESSLARRYKAFDILTFNTAWTSPLPVLQRMLNTWPTLTFCVTLYDEYGYVAEFTLGSSTKERNVVNHGRDSKLFRALYRRVFRPLKGGVELSSKADS